MAIIVDPDNLDRNQVIFSTEGQKISVYPTGALVSPTTPSDGYDGYVASGDNAFYDLNATFVSDGVLAGDILAMYTTAPAGHYVIESVESEVKLVLAADESFTTFDGYYNPIVYEVRQETGGSVTDGVSLQALYSFAKEEWRFDQTNYGSDDLIRHEFPFEAITSEQMEIGGGAAHADWDFFNDYTRKKIRTGGWAAKDTAGITLSEYTGIVTLGSLDADTQVYYQQADGYVPVNFTFLGPVNEPIFVYNNLGDDRRTFLKLFARKKGRTYAGSEISDIGVTTIQTIVNRFPLAHVTDPAIVATDGQILGASPWRDQVSVTTGSDGSKTVSGTTFSSATDFEAANVVAGDVLQITSGNEQGYYTIASVSTTTLTIATDFEFTSWGETENTLSFDVQTTVRAADKAGDGVADDWTTGAIIETGTSGIGTLTDVTNGNFVVDGVVAGDVLSITTDGYVGLYKVLDSTTAGASDPAATVIYVDTSDQAFPASTVSNISYQVWNSGMYLQYKADSVSLGSTGNLTFADANPDTITRASGSWITDGVEIGDVVTITGSANNNGSYTVATVGATVLTLVTTDALVAEGPVGATATVTRHFKRNINGVVYAFSWRVFGNDSTLANIYQFIQHELRQTTDIDYGAGTSRGDVTDLLMSFSTPTGTMFDAFIDDLSNTDLNNVTYIDATRASRAFAFLAAGTISFNNNLQADASAVYRMFFTNDDAGDNLARDFGTPEAITVQDADSVEIAGNVSGSSSVSFSFDYDGNVQRGSGSAGVDAPVTIVAIGLNTAQYVITTGTIERSKANNFSLVAALERNYST